MSHHNLTTLIALARGDLRTRDRNWMTLELTTMEQMRESIQLTIALSSSLSMRIAAWGTNQSLFIAANLPFP